jgi:lipid II:glycine glycyltransferase (peptidoglycan interpeptide bridge formation enzyme)
MLRQYAEAENIPRVELRWPVTAPSSTAVCDDVLHLLDMSGGYEAFRSNLHRNHRKSVVRARRENVTVELDTSREAMDKYYDLQLRTRAWQGVPVQPYRFFVNLHRHLVAKDLGYVALAYHKNRLLSGGVFLHWQKTLTAKYAASLREYLKLRGNNLVDITAVEWACERGFQVLDFGKTAKELEGLRLYKSQWGADEIPLEYTLIPEQTPGAGGSGKLTEIGGVILRNSPRILTRVAGELLYRHFG